MRGANTYPQSNFRSSLNAVFCLILMLCTGWVHAHGGISALDGLLEVMILFSLLVIMAAVWLIFVLYFIFAEQLSRVAFKRFRVTIYVLASLFVTTLLWFMMQEGFHRDILRWMYFIILLTVLMTELTVWLFKKKPVDSD